MTPVLTFTAKNPSDGAHLLVLGAVHGNEKCGKLAINSIIESIKNQKIKIQTGKVSFIPICNPKAFEQNVRYIDKDLNRAFLNKNEDSCYETKLANYLSPIIASADIVLDIHSYQSLGGPFCFLGHSNQAELDFCLNLGINNFAYNWSEAFSQSNNIAIGTIEYARHMNAIATTVECGHHANSNNTEIAINTITKAMQYAKITTPTTSLSAKKHEFFKMNRVFYKEAPGKLTKKWQNFDHVSKHEIIAQYKCGKTIVAPADGCIILPKTNAKKHDEWLYFATKTSKPKASSTKNLDKPKQPDV